MKHILIIEDDEDLISTLKARLETNYKITATSTGLGAVDEVVKESIDLILLDLNLPSLDGDTIMQVFQEKGLAKNIPIIIMSAKSEDDIKQAVDNINADEFIQKPFKMEELIAKIEKVII